MTAVEYAVEKLEKFIPSGNQLAIEAILEQAKEMENEHIEKLWTNEEVFDMLYKTDKFLMIDLREYWKTIEK